MKALVVGGTGFLGLNLALELREQGHEAVATRRRSSNTLFIRRHKIPMVSADLDDRASLVDAMRGRDVVFMVAGHYPRLSIDTAGQLSEAVTRLRSSYEAAREAGVQRFVYTSSSATVAASADPSVPAVESNGLPDVPDGSTYFAVKVGMEQAIAALGAAEGGPELVTLCPTACLGPYDWKVGTGSFVVGVMTGKLQAYVNGRINMVDVRDVARAHVAAAQSGSAGERYLVGGHDLTVKGLLERMAQRYDVPLTAAELSPEAGLELAIAEEARCHAGQPGRPALAREFVDLAVHGIHVDSGKAQAQLGYSSRPLEETLDDAHNWYLNNGYARRERSRTESHANLT